MLSKQGRWNNTGDFMVPDTSPITDRRYWEVAGGLLAVALLAGESLHPVSPALIYALLSNVQGQSEPSAAMHMSLGFIQQLQSSKATDLLPWMIIPPRQDWKILPEGHRTLLLDLVTNLDMGVSHQCLSFFVVRVMAALQLQVIVTKSEDKHVRWTVAIITSAMFGSTHLFIQSNSRGWQGDSGGASKGMIVGLR